MNILIALIAFAVLSGGYGFVLRRWGLRNLTVRRSFDQPAVFAGDEGAMTEVVVNDRPLIIPWLLVESRVSPYLRFGKQDNLEITGDMYHRSVFSVMPWQRITRRHQVRFLRRGVFDVGTAALTAGDVTGIFTAVREQSETAGVVVWPRLLPREELPEPAVRQLGAWSRNRAMQDPFLTRGIRPYLPGDPVRDIHWPATARMGEAQVRVHDPSAQMRLLIVLNGQLTEDQWGDVSDSDQAPLEHAISMAATLCVLALRAGMPAGFACNLQSGGDGSAVSMPGLSPGREEELLTAMARIRLRRTLRFGTFAQALQTGGGLSVLVLSAYDGQDVQESLAALRRQGNDVALALTEGGAGHG